MADIAGQGILRKLDTESVLQLRSDPGDRPVTRTAAMTDPAVNIPPDRPLGQSDGDFQFRAFGHQVAGAGRIGTVVELADQFHRTFEAMKVPVAIVTDIHPATTDRAIPVQDVEFPRSEIRIRGPSVRHPANLLAVERSFPGGIQGMSLHQQFPASCCPADIALMLAFSFVNPADTMLPWLPHLTFRAKGVAGHGSFRQE